MPMVWYIPPLSPVVDVVRETGDDAEAAGNLFGAIDALRIPVEYLAELFTAGDPAPVERRAPAARGDALLHARHQPGPRTATTSIPAAVGMDGETVYDMYRLLAIAKYDERYVIPAAHAEQAHAPGGAGHRAAALDYDGGPGMGGSGPFGESSGGSTPDRGGELPHARAAADRGRAVTPGGQASRVNLLNWDGKGGTEGLFPARPAGSGGDRGVDVDDSAATVRRPQGRRTRRSDGSSR